MRRKAPPFLLAAALVLGGCFAFQQVTPQESKARSTGSIEEPAHMEGEKSMYEETTKTSITWRRTPAATAASRKRRWSCSPNYASTLAIPISATCSPMTQSPPTACVTASTVRLCVLYRTRRCNPRATDISSTCSKSRFRRSHIRKRMKGAIGLFKAIKPAAQVALVAAGVAMVCLGAMRGEADAVLAKAIRLCLECIGIG